jgi:hypothetical protein
MFYPILVITNLVYLATIGVVAAPAILRVLGAN